MNEILDTPNPLECEILNSILDNPISLSEFLTISPIQTFSEKGRYVISKLVAFLENTSDIYSINAFLETLPAKVISSDYMSEVLSSKISSSYTKFAEIFLKKYQLAKMKEVGQRLINASENSELLDISILGKEVEISKTTFKSFSQWEYQHNTEPKIAKIKTGIDFLDSAFDGGFELGQLFLISGDPEAGKTMLGLQFLEYIANYQRVGFFAFEFTTRQYIARQQNRLKKVQKDNIIVINDGYDLQELSLNIKDLYKQGIKVFLIDSQMRIANDKKDSSEESKETAKFSTLAKLCHSLEIIIILIVQTSKTDKDNPAGSKKGAHEASAILRLEHCSVDKNDVMNKNKEWDENHRTLIIKKNKQTGIHYKEKVIFDKDNFTFRSLYFDENKNKIIISQSQLFEELKGGLINDN